MSKTVTIQSQGDFLRLEVIKYSYPDATDNYDNNWLDIVLTLKMGAFSGQYPAYFQTTDFSQLLGELTKLHENLNGQFSFTTLEQQLVLNFKGDGLGHIQIEGTAEDNAGNGNRLNFEIDIDQTAFPAIIQQLSEITSAFPFIVV